MPNSILFCQNHLADQYNFANSLFDKGNFFESITEFKRLQFFDKENKYGLESNYKIGLAYKAGAFFNNSIKYFSLAKANNKNKEIRCDIEFEIIRCNILRRTTERALFLLRKIEEDSTYDCGTEKIDYWRGWAYMFDFNWDSAYVYFSKVKYAEELSMICKSVINDKYSVNFAKIISYILPGAGQIYTGNYISGLLSLSWNVLLGYFTINAFLEDRAFDGAVIGSLLWLRFYRGNIQNAAEFAEEKNLEISNKALERIQKDFKGIKP